MERGNIDYALTKLLTMEVSLRGKKYMYNNTFKYQCIFVYCERKAKVNI